MKFVMVFLEGMITFISPCIVPMLPIYFAYLAGESGNEDDSSRKLLNSKGINKKFLKNAIGFVIGFTIIFVVLGAFSGSLGRLVSSHIWIVNLIAGLVMIIFGLNFMGLISINFLNRNISYSKVNDKMDFSASVLFGLTFGISFSPCVGAFLGSALALSASQGSVITGIIMLLLYSLGLGIPFIASALLVDQLQTSFDFIKRNHKKINFVSGIFLIIMGIITGLGVFNIFAGLIT